MFDKVFMLSVAGFIGGIFLRSYVPFGARAALIVLLAAASVAAVAFFRRPPQFRTWIFLSVLMAALVGGVARYALSDSPAHPLDPYENTVVTLEGTVVTEPDERDASTILTVDADALFSDGQLTPVSGRVRVTAEPYPLRSYGDRLRITGKLEKPETFETSAGGVFDYPSYLAKEGIYHELYRPKISVLASGQGNPAVGTLFAFKSKLLTSVNRSIPEPESGLLAGLLLGEQRSLQENLTESFRRSGIVHIVVLSGYNLTVVAYALMRALSFLPLYVGSFAGALGIIAFTVMAGASATAVRAAIMALIIVLAKATGRQYDMQRALYFAGFLMAAHNPKIVAFDPSFQLSFLAALGLIYLAPFFQRHLCFLPERLNMREIVAATLATQVFVLPRLVGLSGAVSIVGVFANILVLPVIPLTMLMGTLSGFAGFIHMFLALPFSYGAYLLLHYIIFLARFFGNLPFATVSLSSLPSWVLGLSYALLGIFVYRINRRFTPTAPAE